MIQVLKTLLLVATGPLSAQIPLQLVPENAHDLTLTPLGDSTYELTTTGHDPYVFTAPITTDYEAAQLHLLSFDTFTLRPIPDTQVFFLPSLSEKNSVPGGTITSSEGWIPFSIDLSKSPSWQHGKNRFRIDFGRMPGLTFRIRTLQLRARNELELKQQLDSARKTAALAKKESAIQTYFKTTHSSKITQVMATRTSVTILCETGKPLRLAEIRPWQSVHEIRSAQELAWSQILPPGTHTITLDRFPVDDGLPHDRLHSRWGLFHEKNGTLEPASHALYCTHDSATALKSIPIPRPDTKKGLPVTWRPGAMEMLDELGTRHGTLNIDLCALLNLPKNTPHLDHQYLGRTFRINKTAVESLSRVLSWTAKRDYLMGAIILISGHPPKGLESTLLHPDYLPNGIYSMANLTSPEGSLHYAMIIDFLASYFSTKEHGYLHYWIIHNEVDAAWVWTNCGRCGPHTMMDHYVKSMRMVSLTSRQYNPQARVFISLTHFWNQKNTHGPPETMHAPRHLIDILADHSRIEGDFDWGLAYHPYPVNLRNPRVWEDKVRWSFDTDIISYKNLEVLPAYLQQEKYLYQGKPRKIRLTEQGLSNPDDSPEQLKIQAAAVAYAMKKVNAIQGIDAHIMHRWVDHAKEGGLNLGLVKKIPGTISTAGEKKPSFDIYAAIDTPREEEACRFALDLIGIKSWEEIHHREKIK